MFYGRCLGSLEKMFKRNVTNLFLTSSNQEKEIVKIWKAFFFLQNCSDVLATSLEKMKNVSQKKFIFINSNGNCQILKHWGFMYD